MAKVEIEVIFSLLVSFLLISSSIAGSDSPFIVAHKKVSLTRLKSGAEQISVTIDIYNEGSTTAYDVSLTDDSWTEDKFHVVKGEISKSWEKLDAGTSVSHAFTMESNVKGLFHGSPAVVKFRIPSKATFQEAFSTPMLPLDILADKPPIPKFEWAKRFLAKYGSLVSVLLIVALFIYLIATPSSTTKASKKKR